MPALLSPTTWLTTGGAAVDLAALVDEAGALATLAERWESIAGAIVALGAEAPRNDPGQLAAYVLAHVGDEPVAQAFAGLGLADLHARLLARRDRLGTAAKLLQPVSAFGSGRQDGTYALSLPALGAQEDVALGSAALLFNVAAQGGLSCEAGAAWPFADEAVDAQLLRIGGQGSVTTKAGLSLPFGQWGSGTASAGVAGSLSLSLFFRPSAPERSYAGALADVLGAVPSPLDLAGLSQAATLEGLVLSCEGSASAGLALTLGKSIDVPKAVSGTVGLTAALSFERKAHWLLSLRRVPEGLSFVLSRDTLRERNWSAGLDVRLDAAPLARRVHDMLLEAQNFAGPALNQIKPFLSPGTYLATHAASLLDVAARSIVEQPQVRAALMEDLSSLLGAVPVPEGERSSAFAHLLVGAIADLAASHARGFLDDAERWAGAVTADLAKRFPPLAAVPPEDLQARVRPLLTDVANQFDGLVGSLAGDPAWSARLASELAAVGAGIRADEVEADALLAGARTVLERFHGFAEQVIVITADDAKAKIAARFGWSGVNSTTSKYELLGTFTSVTSDTLSLWQALLAGRLEPFQAILADPAVAPPGLVLSSQSGLTRLAGGERGFAAELSLFGIDLSLASIVKGEASVVRNAAGDIAVTAKGSAMRQVEGFGEGRTATFITNADLVRLKADAGAASRQAMVVDVGFDHADKDLKTEEVRAMLAGLADQELIERGRVDHALAIYQEWRVKAASHGTIRGRIALRLRLPAADVERMVAIGRRLNAHDQDVLLKVFGLAVRSQLATGVASADGYARDLRQAINDFTISQKSDEPIAYLVALWNSKVDLVPAEGREGVRLPALAQLIPRSGALVTLLKTMAQIYDAVPTDVVDAQGGGWTAADYAAAEQRMVSASRAWLRLNQSFIAFFKAALHPSLLAFLRVLVTLGQSSVWNDPASGLEEPIDISQSDVLFLITMTADDSTKRVAI